MSNNPFYNRFPIDTYPFYDSEPESHFLHHTLKEEFEVLDPSHSDFYFFNSVTSNMSGIKQDSFYEPTHPPQNDWSANNMSFPYQTIPNFHEPSPNSLDGVGGDLFQGRVGENMTQEHTWPQFHDSRPAGSFGAEASDSPEHGIGSSEEGRHGLTAEVSAPCAINESSGGISRSRDRRSPTMENNLMDFSPPILHDTPALVEILSSIGSEDDEVGSAQGEISAEEERQYDACYAKLIFKALLSAPNHCMALQDIYEWFIQNTDKKDRTTKDGWKNSIRHNLSMNAAFRKKDPATVEPHQRNPATVGPRQKKCSDWILEPFAVENGLKPTTRFRKGGNKPTRSKNPDPARVRAGKAGGVSASKAKQQRQKSRQRSRKPIQAQRTHPGPYQPAMRDLFSLQETSRADLKEFDGNAEGTLYPRLRSYAADAFANIRGVYIDNQPPFYRDGKVGLLSKPSATDASFFSSQLHRP